MMITAAIFGVSTLVVVVWASLSTVHEMRLEIKALRQFCARRGIARYRREDGRWEPVVEDDPIERILRTARRG